MGNPMAKSPDENCHKQKHTKQAQHLTQLPCKKEITFLESCRVGKKNLHDILYSVKLSALNSCIIMKGCSSNNINRNLIQYPISLCNSGLKSNEEMHA